MIVFITTRDIRERRVLVVEGVLCIYTYFTKPRNFINLLITQRLFFFAAFQKLLSAEEKVSGYGRPPSGEI